MTVIAFTAANLESYQCFASKCSASKEQPNEITSRGSLNHDQNVQRATLAESSAGAAESTEIS